MDVEGGGVPVPVEVHGGPGIVFDQDFSNLQRVQRGLRATVKPGVTLGNSQEAIIRYHDQLLDRYMKVAR